jgi:histidinol dehydrogenase
MPGTASGSGIRYTPIASAGNLRARRESSISVIVLMNAIPAQVAGVKRIVVVTPPRSLEQNRLLRRSSEIGRRERGIPHWRSSSRAALAYGTRTIPGSSKDCRPGNAYVQSRKRQVYGAVDIDMLAGPSEGRDRRGRNMRSGDGSQPTCSRRLNTTKWRVWLITWSKIVAEAGFQEVAAQLETLDRTRSHERLL